MRISIIHHNSNYFGPARVRDFTIKEVLHKPRKKNRYYVFREKGRCGRPMAVKIPTKYSADGHPQGSSRSYLYKEMKAHAFLDRDRHPNIAQFYGSGEFILERPEINQRLYVPYSASECVAGPDLGLIVRTVKQQRLGQSSHRQALLPMLALLFIYDAACGLKYIHDLGWVYGDMKLTNLILDMHTFLAKLVDFESARPANQYLKEEQAARWRFGTPGHLSHRHLTSLPPQPRDDIFALGICLYMALTGQSALPIKRIISKHRRLGLRISRLADLGISPASVTLLHRMTGTTGELNVFEENGFEHAGQVVEYLQHFPDPRYQPSQQSPQARANIFWTFMQSLR